MTIRITFMALAFCIPSIANAATIETSLLGGVAMGGAGAPLSMFDNFFRSSGPEEAIEKSDNDTAAAAGDFGSGTASAQYSVNGTTGELRLGARASASGFVDDLGRTGRGSSNALAQLALSETFDIVGTGTVTVGMAVTAQWGAENFNLEANAGYRAIEGIGGALGNSDFLSLSDANREPFGQLDNFILSTSFDIIDATAGRAELFWQLQGSAVIGGGLLPGASSFLNAMNTANIFVQTTGDILVTPTNPLFLSQQVYSPPDGPAVIPLPASGVFLLAAIMALGSFRRLRSPKKNGPALG